MTTYGMTAPALLADVNLLQRCCYWRKEAVRGAATARTKAHAYEAEVVRRIDLHTTVCGTLDLDAHATAWILEILVSLRATT